MEEKETCRRERGKNIYSKYLNSIILVALNTHGIILLMKNAFSHHPPM